jgi:hypothetical protein
MLLRGFIVSLGLAVVISGGWASAQDAPKAIQVVIGADGSVKVIDVKTGKVIADVAGKVQEKPAPKADDQEKKQRDQARQQLERALQQLREKQAGEPKPQPPIRKDAKPADKPAIEWHILGGAPANSVDKKLDLILQQLAELRRDVNQLKGKVEGKQPPAVWQVIPRDGKPQPMQPVPPPAKDKKQPDERRIELKLHTLDLKPGGLPWQIVPAPGGKEKPKIDADLQRQIEDLIKRHLEKKGVGDAKPGAPRIQVIPFPAAGKDGTIEIELELKDTFLKKVGKEQPKAAPQPRSPADIEREIQQLLQQVERLQAEIRNRKPQK